MIGLALFNGMEWDTNGPQTRPNTDADSLTHTLAVAAIEWAMTGQDGHVSSVVPCDQGGVQKAHRLQNLKYKRLIQHAILDDIFHPSERSPSRRGLQEVWRWSRGKGAP